MERYLQERFDDVLPPLAEGERSPSSVMGDGDGRIPSVVHMPRLLERCSAIAIAAIVSFCLGAVFAMAFPRLSAPAVEFMFGATVVIVATMIVAAAVVMRTFRSAERTGFPA